MKICITGGAGFIGFALSEAFARKGHHVVVVDCVPPRYTVENITFVKADLLKDEVPAVFSECEAIVHLAGASIFKRWNTAYKKLIRESRVKSAEAIFNYISKTSHRLKVFVSASAVGYYGDRGEETLTEEARPGNDFLADVCVEWEKASRRFEELGVRSVSIRTAIVMGQGGGMLAVTAPLYKWFLGGRLGSGTQWFSWIHRDDLVNIYMSTVKDERFSGPINAVSPGALRNKDFTRALGKALHRPVILSVPAFVLRIALGEFGEAVLASQRAVPKKINDAGFTFQYPDINSAFSAIFPE